MDRDERIAATRHLMSINIIQFQGATVLIRNIRDAATRKKVKKLNGLSPDDWANWYIGRLNVEPIARILWCAIRDAHIAKIGIHEVLCEDPTLMIDALEKGDMGHYYARYPPRGDHDHA